MRPQAGFSPRAPAYRLRFQAARSLERLRTDYVDINPLTGSPDVITLAKNDKLHEAWVPGAIHQRTCPAAI